LFSKISKPKTTLPRRPTALNVASINLFFVIDPFLSLEDLLETLHLKIPERRTLLSSVAFMSRLQFLKKNAKICLLSLDHHSQPRNSPIEPSFAAVSSQLPRQSTVSTLQVGRSSLFYF
jgi:hypothetical protein